MVTVINILATNIFEYTAFLIGAHTVVEETYEKFINISFMMFVNTSVIIILVNMNAWGTSETVAE
jgi:hypothetical protein